MHLSAVTAREEEPILDLALPGDVQAQLDRYVEFPSPAHSLVVAHWVIHTWTLPAAYVTPYLYISSSGPATGKTRTMDTLSTLVRNPDSGTDSPVHVLGQEIEANSPTLFFDEIDTVWAGWSNNPLKRILNIGFQRGAVIKRQRGNVIERWSVFSPKVLAGIRNNHLPESLLSRCIRIEMEPRSRELERFNKFHVIRDPARKALVDRIAYFAEHFMDDVANQRPEYVRALDDRENEIAEPLLALAAVLGTEQELRGALAKVFAKDAAAPSREQTFLSRIRDAFDKQAREGGPADKIFTEDLLPALGPMYTPRLLGILLAEMGLHRDRGNIRIDTQQKKGYMRSDFEPLFARYLDRQPLRLAEEGDDER